MRRVAFKMKFKPGKEEEYRFRHDHIWPELKETLTKAGIRDYTIFLDSETNSLFAVQKLTEDNNVEELPFKEIMKRWWDYMADLMETNPDNSPLSFPLNEVFHMD